MIVPDVGGAFGSKGAPAPETMLVAAAAMTAGRPVKWAEDREENFVASYQGRGMEADVELALDADGRDPRDPRAHLGGSRRLPDADHRDPRSHHRDADVRRLRHPRRRCRSSWAGARTRCPPAPTGAPGGPRPPTSWRARWTWRRASSGSTRSSCGAATSSASSRTRRRSAGPTTPATTRAASTSRRSSSGQSGTPTTQRVVGTGFGMYVERAGGLFETAEAELLPDGRLLVRSGSSPHGQGHDTTFAQLAADRLGCRAGGRGAPLRRLEGGPARRRHLRQPLRGDGRVGGRAGGRCPQGEVRAGRGGAEHVAARGRGGRAGDPRRAPASSPTSSSRRAPTEPSSRSSARPGGCACCASPRSTTPGRS